MAQENAAGRPQHGTLAEEAAKLAEVAQLWLTTRTGAAGEDPWAAATDGLGHAPECRSCPLCRAVRFVRDVNPEVLAHLSDAAASVAAAVAAMGGKDDSGRDGPTSPDPS